MYFWDIPLDTLNILSFNNIELHTKIGIAGIPIYIDALGTDYKDPFDNKRNPSYFSFNFLAEEWKENQKAKIRGQIDEEVNSIYPISGDMKLAANKSEYFEKVFNSKSVVDDFGNLKNEFQTMIDSIGSIEKVRSLLKSREEEIIQLVNQNLLDSLDGVTIRDSIQNIYSSIERYNKYEELLVVKDSCERIKNSIDEKLELISNYKNSIYSKPAEINRRLSSLKNAKTIDKILNYVDIFRVGIINPKFSKYSLATSQNKGVHIGLNFDYLTIETFYAQSIERSSNFNDVGDSKIKNYFGSKITIQYNEFLSNSFFYVSKLEEYVNPSDGVGSQIGYTFDFTKNNRKLKFETVWSRLDPNSDNIEYNLVKIFSNAAIDLTYDQKGESLNYNWSTNLKFLGQSFADFNNPFLFNNNLSINSRISFSLIKELRTSIHTNFQEGNIQEKTSALNRRCAFGGNNTFVKQGWPIISHTFQYGVMDINDNIVITHLQNISGQFSLELLNLNSVNSILFSWNNNTSQIDSLNTSFRSVSFSNSIELTEIFSINLIGDYSQLYQSADDGYNIYSFELSPSVTLKNFNLNIGLKYLKDRSKSRIGWLTNLIYTFNKSINLSLDLDNSIFERYINETGEIKDNFYERYSGSLNYKF